MQSSMLLFFSFLCLPFPPIYAEAHCERQSHFVLSKMTSVPGVNWALSVPMRKSSLSQKRDRSLNTNIHTGMGEKRKNVMVHPRWLLSCNLCVFIVIARRWARLSGHTSRGQTPCEPCANDKSRLSAGFWSSWQWQKTAKKKKMNPWGMGRFV